MLLFESGSETSGASVAMEAEGSCCVDDYVPLREDKCWGRGEFREEGANDVFHCGSENERGALFEEGRNWADEAGHVGEELALVTKTAEQAAELLNVRRHRHACQSSDSIVVGADAILRNDAAQEVYTCGSDPGFFRGEL